MTRRPKIYSAAEPHGRTAAGSLDQNDPVATNGPEIGARAAASAPDSTSQVSNRLAVLAELSVADLRLEWRQLFRADPPRLSRDIMMRAVAYRLQESAHGSASERGTKANFLVKKGRSNSMKFGLSECGFFGRKRELALLAAKRSTVPYILE